MPTKRTAKERPYIELRYDEGYWSVQYGQSHCLNERWYVALWKAWRRNSAARSLAGK